MYIKKHRSGSGWDYQFAIPRPLQKLIGKTQFSGYIPGRQDRAGEREAQAVAIMRAREDSAEIASIKALPEHARAAYIAKGGLKAMRRTLPAFEWQLSATRQLVAVGAEVNPLEVAAEEDLPLQNVISETWAERQHLQNLAAQVAQHRDMIAKAEGKPRQLGNGMRDLFDLWAKTPLQRTGKPPEIVAKHKASVKRFIAICGNLSVREITRDHVRKFYDANDRELPNKPAARVKHRDHIKALLNLAASERWRDDNPADKIRISVAPRKADEDDEEGKKPFTPQQLIDILAAAKVEWWDNPDALLALRVLIYSGARSNEVCQLRATDIETVDGIPCIRIRKGPGQSVKNKPSRRVVPLHREIAGEVLARVRDGREWLFPSFPHDNPKEHKRWLAGAFNGRQKPDGTYVGLLRGVLSITDPDLTLHSLRHSFKDACRRARVDRETRNELMGHGKGSVHEEYGDEMLELMADAIHDVNPLSGELKPRKAA